MIIRRKPIKKSNKREYIIIETPGPGDFLWRATEKDKAIKVLFGEGKRRLFFFFNAAGLDLTWGKVIDALFLCFTPTEYPWGIHSCVPPPLSSFPFCLICWIHLQWIIAPWCFFFLFLAFVSISRWPLHLVDISVTGFEIQCESCLGRCLPVVGFVWGFSSSFVFMTLLASQKIALIQLIFFVEHHINIHIHKCLNHC